MPDWTYQTIFRPILRQLPYGTAQSIAFGAMGMLGRNPIGAAMISLMGHAKPQLHDAVACAGLQLPARVALGCGVDLRARAVSATSLFGFGLIEVGPVRISDNESDVVAETSWRSEGLRVPQVGAGISVTALASALRSNRRRNGVSVIARFLIGAESDLAVLAAAVRELTGLIDGVSLALPVSTDGRADIQRLATLVQIVTDARCPVFVAMPTEQSARIAEALTTLPICGVILTHGLDENGVAGVLGDRIVTAVAAAVEEARSLWKARLLIANGGVREPADAVRLINAGADVVMIDSGFAEAGPGLPKRINAAVRAVWPPAVDLSESVDSIPIPHRSWFWCFLLGLSLLVGGLLAVVIGWTRVVLPYDEEFLGMLRDEICGLNPQLLPFMSHDRVTLAGTMLALGPLYLALAWFGDRRGMHWARTAVLASSFVGFLSFFLFLGFGYFDPFHAFISAILFQFMTLGLRSSQPPEGRAGAVDLNNSASWKRAMWGQLLMVVHGAAILTAGVIISSFGVTSVFVPDDLEFMQTTREALVDANPRLIPLVAHDRASFGGMLMSTGVTVLLSSLWGWHRGRRWLWWALAASGTIAYSITILIHWSVGYTSLQHLLPPYGGLLFLWLAMLLSREWMFEKQSDQVVRGEHSKTE